jgi:hypothetical protein
LRLAENHAVQSTLTMTSKGEAPKLVGDHIVAMPGTISFGTPRSE